jgi:cobalt-precorrin 5A hydrolase/precorrin-3B C17-methyltransferase
MRVTSDLVGYKLYLDLVGNAASGKTLHPYELGEERDRVIRALDIAAEGKTVGLISSGDPGIYAMASLVFDCLKDFDKPSWNLVEIVVSPGISAVQACAAKAGAPLGHDFCAISLSDLLTPWSVIEKRIKAATESDFVIALYNPASGRRRNQLVKTIEIIKQGRGPQTPVIIGRSLGRPEEKLEIMDIQDFEPDSVDMLSIVIVGSTQTKTFRGRVFTPRGYLIKKNPNEIHPK